MINLFLHKQSFNLRKILANQQKASPLSKITFPTLEFLSVHDCNITVKCAYILTLPSWLAETKVDLSIQDTSKT